MVRIGRLGGRPAASKIVPYSHPLHVNDPLMRVGEGRQLDPAQDVTIDSCCIDSTATEIGQRRRGVSIAIAGADRDKERQRAAAVRLYA